MDNDRVVVYINWDGFAAHYYDLASSQSLIPTINHLRKVGVFFTNARTGIPSITNPMQTAIASGAYASRTGNVKIFYDKEQRIIVEQRRENRAENMADAFFRQGLTVASVHHFTFEDNGTYAGDPQRPYISLPYGTYTQRFDQLYRVLAGDTVYSGNSLIKMNKIPRFVAMYMDDLDTVGHNNGTLAPMATTEGQRMENILWRLHQMDTALGRFLERVSLLELYPRLSFFLITDHGMTPFQFNETSIAAYQDLLTLIRSKGYRFEVLKPGERPSPFTDIVLCSAGLSLLLSFIRPVPFKEILALQALVSNKTYVGKVMNAYEIQNTGSTDFCDLYISPSPPHIFKDYAPAIGGTHDSLDETSQHIFSLMWGAGIVENLTITRQVNTIDFAPTMAHLLNAAPPAQSEGKIITEALQMSRGDTCDETF